MQDNWNTYTSIQLTVHPSLRSEAANAVPETPAGILGTIARSSPTISPASPVFSHLNINESKNTNKQKRISYLKHAAKAICFIYFFQAYKSVWKYIEGKIFAFSLKDSFNITH